MSSLPPNLPPNWNGTSFGSVAQMYDASRPTYPVETVRWMLGPPVVDVVDAAADAALDVVDVGAGTGKMSDVLLALGHRVTAVDPDPGMLDVLTKKLPAARSLLGTAEQIPIPDSSVDALTMAQSFHWVDPAVAFVEIARVLRPGGWLGVVWNERDETDDWTPQISRAWGERAEAVGASFDREVPEHPLFGPVALHETTHTQELTTEQLLALTSSRSYVIALEPRNREQLLDEIRSLTDRHHHATGHANITIRYVARAYRMQKL